MPPSSVDRDDGAAAPRKKHGLLKYLVESSKNERQAQLNKKIKLSHTSPLDSKLSDPEMRSLFSRFEKSLPLKGLDALAKDIQQEHGLMEPPPVEMVHRMRKQAIAKACEWPKDVGQDKEFQEWVKSTSNAASSSSSDTPAIDALNQKLKSIREAAEKLCAPEDPWWTSD